MRGYRDKSGSRIKMQEDTTTTTFKVPSFAKREAYDFDTTTRDSMAIYEELTAISEEIEKCRLRNC